MGLPTDTGESVALHDALETLTLGGTDDIDKLDVLSEDVGDSENVTELGLTGEVGLELDDLSPAKSASNSTTFFLGVVPAFSKWPFRALLVCFSFFSS